MKRVSRVCALQSESCLECDMDLCGCRCHTIEKLWVNLPDSVREKTRRYFSEQRGHDWVVVDRGTKSKPEHVIAVCDSRVDAYNIQHAMNKRRDR